MSVAANLEEIRLGIPDNVKLIAVSKFQPVERVREAYDAGQLVFGENRMQEIDIKHIQLPDDVEWHFIGHLQTNKVKYILPYIHTIHSVDSLKLLGEIEKLSATLNKTVNCLLEIHIAQEDSKYGFSFEECRRFLADNDWKKCKFANIVGLMGMATYTNDEDQIRSEFKSLRNFFNELKKDFFSQNSSFKELSMGMSNDYKIAIEEGSTMVRIGTAIFGER